MLTGVDRILGIMTHVEKRDSATCWRRSDAERPLRHLSRRIANTSAL